MSQVCKHFFHTFFFLHFPFFFNFLHFFVLFLSLHLRLLTFICFSNKRQKQIIKLVWLYTIILEICGFYPCHHAQKQYGHKKHVLISKKNLTCQNNVPFTYRMSNYRSFYHLKICGIYSQTVYIFSFKLEIEFCRFQSLSIGMFILQVYNKRFR